MPLALFFSAAPISRVSVCWPPGSRPQGRNRATELAAPGWLDSLLATAAPLAHFRLHECVAYIAVSRQSTECGLAAAARIHREKDAPVASHLGHR